MLQGHKLSKLDLVRMSVSFLKILCRRYHSHSLSVYAGVCCRILSPSCRFICICSSIQCSHCCWNGKLRSVPVQWAFIHLWPWDIRMPGNCVCGHACVCVWMHFCVVPMVTSGEESKVWENQACGCMWSRVCLGGMSGAVISPVIINNPLFIHILCDFLSFGKEWRWWS